MASFDSDVKTINVIFDTNPMRPYIPGEQVCGTVIFTTEEENVKIQQATLTIIAQVSILSIDVSVIPHAHILKYIYIYI